MYFKCTNRTVSRRMVCIYTITIIINIETKEHYDNMCKCAWEKAKKRKREWGNERKRKREKDYIVSDKVWQKNQQHRDDNK